MIFTRVTHLPLLVGSSTFEGGPPPRPTAPPPGSQIAVGGGEDTNSSGLPGLTTRSGSGTLVGGKVVGRPKEEKKKKGWFSKFTETIIGSEEGEGTFARAILLWSSLTLTLDVCLQKSLS